MGIVISIAVPVFVLGLLILMHEFGHFIVAKLCGVGVVKFSIGFGPALLRMRFGETVYQLSAIPLGGYVRMVGDMPDFITGKEETDEGVRALDEESKQKKEDEELLECFADRSRWFIEQPFWSRTAIVAAGPIFNFLLALILVWISVSIYGEEYSLESPVIGSIMTSSPAQKAGLLVGDRVLQVGEDIVSSWEALAERIHRGPGVETPIIIERNGEQQRLLVTPDQQGIRDFSGNKKEAFLIGIGPSFAHRQASIFRAAEVAGIWTVMASWRTLQGLWGIVSGKISAKELAGPIFIVGEANRQAGLGFERLLFFMAILSVSLAVLNLLPIPVLDGGHLLFFVLEAIIGPISVRAKELAQQFGMVLLLALMVFALHNDIFHHLKSTSRSHWSETEKP